MEQITRLALSGILLIITTVTGWAQKGVEDGSKYGHGTDSIRCLKSLSLYREFIKYENFKDAIISWRIVFMECPECSQNIYIDGAKMYNYYIMNEKDPAIQNELIDTLMMIYDQRIKYFDQKGAVLGRKAVDLFRYKKDNNTIEEVYGYLEESINLLKNKSSIPVVAAFMTTTYTLFAAGKFTDIKVIENYAIASDIVDYTIACDPENQDAQKVKESIDLNFISSGVPTCQSLLNFFKPLFEEKKEDIPYLKRAVTFLGTLDCEQEPFYAQVSEALYIMEPSAQSAFSLAKLFVTRDEFNKAVKYYLEAIEKEINPDNKADYYYQLGVVTNSKLNDPQAAKKYALEAINYRPYWGEPYILLGDAYVAGKDCFQDDFEKSTIYWAAVDKFIKAKSVDTAVSVKANERIQTYSMYFPDVETIFFYSLKHGDPYTVGCWINEKTTVRSR